MSSNLKRFAKASSFAAVLTAVSLISIPAMAEDEIAVDVEAAWADDPNESTGLGVGLRAGHVWDIAIITITPELGASYHDFDGAADPTAWDVKAGGRFGIDLLLEPSVYAHAGLGHFGYDLPDGDVSQTSLAYDVGAALDVTVLPVIDFGVHATFAGIAGNDEIDPFSWIAVGGHVAFAFNE
jgi:hypothetical protein